MRFTSEIHRRWVGLVDDASFLAINLFHARHHQQASSPASIERYLAGWREKTAEDYFHTEPFDLQLDFCREQRLELPSPLPCSFSENNRAVVDFFPCDTRKDRPTMLILHGLMSVSDVGYRRWAKLFNQHGWHAAFVHLPYHYDRRPSGFWSGELAVGPDGIRTVEGIRQAVVEVRALAQGLHAQGIPFVGLLGMSYGGWVGALACCVEPLVRCALLMEPIVDFSHAVWDSPASVTLRREMAKQGVTIEMVNALNHLVNPGDRKPVCPVANIAFLAAEYDRVTPPAVIESLARRWECPRYRCYPQGHVGYRLQREAFREWREDFAPLAEL